jgi:hypothetical protein
MEKQTAVIAEAPHRIGLFFVGNELKAPAAKLFILAMNGVQQGLEYECLPEMIEDALLIDLNKPELDREATPPPRGPGR